MFQVRHIDSLDLPELAPYRTMRRHHEHVLQRIFVAEGAKVVRRLLETPFIIESILMVEKWLPELREVLTARQENIQVFVVPMEVMEQLVGFTIYQGILAVAKFPEPPALDDVLATAPSPRLLVALDGLADAENLGVIARNSAAFGVHLLIAGETCTSPYMRRAVRNSMGAMFKLPIIESTSLVETLHLLRKRGIRCIAAHGESQSQTLARCDLKRDCCIVLGNEGNGVSPAVLAACDEAVAIPMANSVDSLNVANAAAVFLYEASRQRGAM
jgi:tRNA G18 (ribose-2'-O)-methylase SpoU